MELGKHNECFCGNSLNRGNSRAKPVTRRAQYNAGKWLWIDSQMDRGENRRKLSYFRFFHRGRVEPRAHRGARRGVRQERVQPRRQADQRRVHRARRGQAEDREECVTVP